MFLQVQTEQWLGNFYVIIHITIWEGYSLQNFSFLCFLHTPAVLSAATKILHILFKA